MAYVNKKCAACGRKDEVYHNVMKCRRCKTGDLIGEFPYQFQSMRSLRLENVALRAEVNALRDRLHLGIKYREWDGGPKVGARMRRRINETQNRRDR